MSLIQNNISTEINNRKLQAFYSEGERMSLKELENRSKIFARMLRDSGCSKGEPICCVMEKSIDFMVALKGIAHIGCRCIPVDPDQPIDHIQSIILKSGTEWIIGDRNAESLVNSEYYSQSGLNVGWMDSIEKLPENCFPEFVRDNIEDISLHSVRQDRDKTEPLICFYDLQNIQELNVEIFTEEEVESFFIPVLEFIDLDANSKIAGLMDYDSPSMLLETMSLFRVGAQLYLFSNSQNKYREELINNIQEQQISHLFLEAEQLGEFANLAITENISCCSIEKIVLWDQLPSEKNMAKLKKVFPNSTIYKISRDPDNGLFIHSNQSSSNRFIPEASIPTNGKEFFNSWELYRKFELKRQ